MDGVGKSTHASLLRQAIAKSGMTCEMRKLPMYDWPSGKLLKRMLETGAAVAWPVLFQFFQVLDKLLFQWFVLPFLSRRVDFVVLDRWHVSSWAYGSATDVPGWINRLFIKPLMHPDVTLVFQGTCKRASARDAYEADMGIQKRVKFYYTFWLGSGLKSAMNSQAVDADGELSTVHVKVVNAVNQALIRRGKDEIQVLR